MKFIMEFNEKDIVNYEKDITQMFSVVTAMAMLNKDKQKQIMEKRGSFKEQTVQEKVEKQPQNVQEQVQQQSAQEQQPQYSLQQLQQAANKKAKGIEGGLDKVKAIIKKYGVDKLPDMKQSDYASFLKDLEGLQ